MSDDKYRVEVRLLGSKSGRMTLKVKTVHEGEDRPAAEEAFSDTVIGRRHYDLGTPDDDAGGAPGVGDHGGPI